MTSSIVEAPKNEPQEVDFKALFIKERYERLQIEAASIQKRFAEIQREMGDIEKMVKANEAAAEAAAPDKINEVIEAPIEEVAKETPTNEL